MHHAAESRRANPCYDSIRPFAHCLDYATAPSLEQLNELARQAQPQPCNAQGQALRFVAQTPLTASMDYETCIYTSGDVPTRPLNWHDAFNALAWLSFPSSKAALNGRHVAARDEPTAKKPRSAVKDALTLFDECGVIVVSDRADLLALVRDFSWKELFWLRRRDVQQHMKFFTFGHGLMAQLLTPYMGLTAKALLFTIASTWLQANQEALLQHVDATTRTLIASPGSMLQGRDLAPLPVLGIPGWATENEDEAYYDNLDYFRPGRRA